MKNIIFIALIILPCMLQAQQSWKPWGVAEAGLLFGSYEGSGDLRLQGGMKKGSWLLGAGAGTDGYRLNSIPVYAQVRKMMGRKNMKPFVMGSFGANFAGKINPPFEDLSFVTMLARPDLLVAPESTYRTGTYFDIGAGLAFRTHKKFGFNLSLSYTRKTQVEDVTQSIFNGTGGIEPATNSNKFMMNRYAVRIGMQL
jgi:hypothetical protein